MFYRGKNSVDGYNTWCKACRQSYEKQSNTVEVRRQYRQKVRSEMIEAYGGACSCCGEVERSFLVLDHIDGGGEAERRQLGGSKELLMKLRRGGWPQDGYQLLCSNCNLGKEIIGTCPHTLEDENG